MSTDREAAGVPGEAESLDQTVSLGSDFGRQLAGYSQNAASLTEATCSGRGIACGERAADRAARAQCGLAIPPRLG